MKIPETDAVESAIREALETKNIGSMVRFIENTGIEVGADDVLMLVYAMNYIKRLTRSSRVYDQRVKTLLDYTMKMFERSNA